jgi:rSAM/selenodomain-associated transferase 2
MRASIIVPALDEAAAIAGTLDALASARTAGHQVIVVDGGSRDATIALSRVRADVVVAADRGRARQLNAGAAIATGDVLLFLHADTRLPIDALELVGRALAKGYPWGRFDVRIEGRSRLLPMVGFMMNLRSRFTGIATGDQAMFVQRDLFFSLGGFVDQPLMEDVELSTRLRAVARPACLRERVLTSGRRWDTRGAWRTILLMWRLRWHYWRGTPPEQLAKAYR